MKKNLLLLLTVILTIASVKAQLDADSQKKLADKKAAAKLTNTVLWMYDTVYRQGDAYCLLKSRRISDDGKEYVVNNLSNQEVIYVTEPGDISKLVGKITGDATVEFSFIKERQKLDVPKKSITTLPDFIVEHNLVANGAGNMAAVKKLLAMHSDKNPQGFTANVNKDSLDVVIAAGDSVKKAEIAVKSTQTDTGKYAPVVRNKKAKLIVENYKIMQDGVLVGRYDKTSKGDDSKSVYTFKSPDWKEVATATNGGLGSMTWEIAIKGVAKKEIVRTGMVPDKALKQIVEFLVNNNHL
ncbi:MAG: hypothetical protein ACO1PI_12965 [Bacteroidota bacterium]